MPAETHALFGLKPGELIALAALALSVLNFFYTRRKFQQSTDPEIDLIVVRGAPGMPFIPEPAGIIGLIIKNLNTSVSLTDLRVALYLRPATRSFARRYGGWLKTYHYKLPSVGPNAESDTWEMSEDTGRVAEAITKYFPGYLEAFPKGQTFRVLKTQEWEAKLVLRYRGAVVGSRGRRAQARLLVSPSPNTQGSLIHKWERRRTK